MFWLFGHPEVYVLILPAFAIFSEVLPVFSRKPLFGYQFVVFSGIAIGFIGFGVWAHHMYAAGLGPVANTAFGISTAIIGVPTGIKIFNWMAHDVQGRSASADAHALRIGGIMMFVIGGLSGVTHSIVPSDYQQTDTYYIVAHFHYVIFGGGVFAFFGGLVLLVAQGLRPRMFPERTAKLAVLDHARGLQPDVRPDARPGSGRHDPADLHVPAGLGLYAVEPGRHGRRVHDRPVGRDLRGRRRSPRSANPGARERGPVGCAHARVDDHLAPPVHNFDEIPTVHSLDEFWHRKYAEDKEGRSCGARPARRTTPGGHGAPGRRSTSRPVVLAARRGVGPADRWPTASSTRGGSLAPGALVLLVGALRVGHGALGGGGATMADAAIRPTTRTRDDDHGPAEHEARDVAVPRAPSACCSAR